jgi:uncharacterized membrane protein YsdA (DUF1294 family)
MGDRTMDEGQVILVICIAYVFFSIVSIVVYRSDKLASERGGRRMPEITLHLLGFAGGWPGAIFAQKRFRHKTRKQPFRLLFWLTVLGNVLIVASCLVYRERLATLLGWF